MIVKFLALPLHGFQQGDVCGKLQKHDQNDKIIPLIPASVAYLLIAGCGGTDAPGAEPSPDVAISERRTREFRSLEITAQDEGKLPASARSKVDAFDGVAPVSVYPPNVSRSDNLLDTVDNCPTFSILLRKMRTTTRRRRRRQ